MKSRDLLIENTESDDLRPYLPVIFRHNLSLCLDIGHAVAAHDIELFLQPKLHNIIRMIHAYAPFLRDRAEDAPRGKHRHLPLSLLDDNGKGIILYCTSRLFFRTGYCV